MDRTMSFSRSRPLIVITGPNKGYISRFFIRLSLLLCGARSQVVRPKDNYSNLEMDGLIISGGDDLYYAFFEEESCELDDVITYKRDVLEYTLLHKAIEKNIPVFGICRGYQLINIFFGGKLYKDIRKEGYEYRYTPFAWKNISIKSKGLLQKVLKRREIQINTLHHQAVKDIPKNFKVEAMDEYEIIQSISYRDSKSLIYGVQWHPEYLFFMKNHLKLFKLLVQTASNGINSSLQT